MIDHCSNFNYHPSKSIGVTLKFSIICGYIQPCEAKSTTLLDCTSDDYYPPKFGVILHMVRCWKWSSSTHLWWHLNELSTSRIQISLTLLLMAVWCCCGPMQSASPPILCDSEQPLTPAGGNSSGTDMAAPCTEPNACIVTRGPSYWHPFNHLYSSLIFFYLNSVIFVYKCSYW